MRMLWLGRVFTLEYLIPPLGAWKPKKVSCSGAPVFSMTSFRDLLRNSPLVARKNGLTPFSVYQGRWNAAYRDMESEIIPMCEDQGMAIVSWASLGGGQLMSSEQRKEAAKRPDSRPAVYSQSEEDVA